MMGIPRTKRVSFIQQIREYNISILVFFSFRMILLLSQYSIFFSSRWVDQIICFIEEVVVSNQNNKVHLVGNSVGGYLSVMIALKRPDLVDTITLLNATPVWGLNLPFWDGRLPAPFIPKKIGRYLFDRIRDLNTIDKYLEAAYSDPRAYDDVLISQIRSCTENNGGHAAFASILYSPPCSVSNDKEKKKTSFTEKIERLKCDVLLIFGKDDPWCKSAFAKSMMLSLNSREHNYVQRYVELSNCGHCPNHEAPQAVAKILNNWLSKNDRKSEQLNLIFGSGQTSKDQNQHHSITEPWGTEILMREVLEEEVNNLSLLDKISTKLVG